jgi:hypothetical protein
MLVGRLGAQFLQSFRMLSLEYTMAFVALEHSSRCRQYKIDGPNVGTENVEVIFPNVFGLYELSSIPQDGVSSIGSSLLTCKM